MSGTIPTRHPALPQWAKNLKNSPFLFTDNSLLSHVTHYHCLGLASFPLVTPEEPFFEMSPFWFSNDPLNTVPDDLLLSLMTQYCLQWPTIIVHVRHHPFSSPRYSPISQNLTISPFLFTITHYCVSWLNITVQAWCHFPLGPPKRHFCIFHFFGSPMTRYLPRWPTIKVQKIWRHCPLWPSKSHFFQFHLFGYPMTHWLHCPWWPIFVPDDPLSPMTHHHSSGPAPFPPYICLRTFKEVNEYKFELPSPKWKFSHSTTNTSNTIKLDTYHTSGYLFKSPSPKWKFS